MSSWAVKEARLATTKVQDLLDEAALRLGRLAADEDLTPDIARDVADALAAVRAGEEAMRAARRRLHLGLPDGSDG